MFQKYIFDTILYVLYILYIYIFGTFCILCTYKSNSLTTLKQHDTYIKTTRNSYLVPSLMRVVIPAASGSNNSAAAVSNNYRRQK